MQMKLEPFMKGKELPPDIVTGVFAGNKDKNEI
jgi:hypothetical protein